MLDIVNLPFFPPPPPQLTSGVGWVRKWVKETRMESLFSRRPHPHHRSSQSPLRGNSRERGKERKKGEEEEGYYPLTPFSQIRASEQKYFCASLYPLMGRRVSGGGNANDVKFEVFLYVFFVCKRARERCLPSSKPTSSASASFCRKSKKRSSVRPSEEQSLKREKRSFGYVKKG